MGSISNHPGNCIYGVFYGYWAIHMTLILEINHRLFGLALLVGWIMYIFVGFDLLNGTDFEFTSFLITNCVLLSFHLNWKFSPSGVCGDSKPSIIKNSTSYQTRPIVYWWTVYLISCQCGWQNAAVNYKVSSELFTGDSRRDRLHVRKLKEIECSDWLIYPRPAAVLDTEKTSASCAFNDEASPLKHPPGFTSGILGLYWTIGLLICRSIDGSVTSLMAKKPPHVVIDCFNSRRGAGIGPVASIRSNMVACKAYGMPIQLFADIRDHSAPNRSLV